VKYLVTGATGFLGMYIVEQLRARGDAVRALARRSHAALDSLGVETLRGDIQDAAAVERACTGVDCVIHTAGVAGLAGPWSHYFGVNTLGTRHVVAGCLKNRVPRLVFTSSPSVTFAGVDQCNVDESASYPERWLGHYSHSKALAEQAVLAANSEQLRTCSLRPHLIWGPRDQHLIPRLLERARRGKLRRVGDGQNLVDTVYVENAADAHLLAADRLTPGSPVCGKAYFITQGEPVNCWGWIDELLALAQLPPVKKSISLPAAYAAGAVLETMWSLLRLPGEPRMTRFLAAQLATSHYFDLSRARADLGYSPRISMEEGMRRLAASF
jgi:nucleoside-diphosphate-sugar epimerase